MGIQNGPAPEGRANSVDQVLTHEQQLQYWANQRDSLKVQLAESERLRQEAFAACEQMRLERDEWKAAAEYQQQQATQLRLQVAALEAAIDDVQSINKTLAGQAQDKQRQSQVLMKERDDRTAQLQSAIDELRLVRLQDKDLTTARDAAFREIGELQQQVADLQAQLNEASKSGWVVVGSHLPDREQLDTEIVRLTNNWGREIDERKALQQQVAELQAQLEAAAVTPAQQPDGTAERLETLRELIDAVLGWYACTEYLGEANHAVVWEQVGALLGHLQREAG